jgi:hypothetical protein
MALEKRRHGAAVCRDKLLNFNTQLKNTLAYLLFM